MVSESLFVGHRAAWPTDSQEGMPVVFITPPQAETAAGYHFLGAACLSPPAQCSHGYLLGPCFHHIHHLLIQSSQRLSEKFPFNKASSLTHRLRVSMRSCCKIDLFRVCCLFHLQASEQAHPSNHALVVSYSQRFQ